MSEVWEHVTTYCGCVIERMWSPLFEYYLYRSPCDPHLRTSLSATKKYIEGQGHCGVPPPPPPPIGYQINVTVSPAASGISVQLWWVLGGVPAMIIDTINTGSNGQVSFNPGASSYPVYMRVIVPAGQTIGGTEYGGDESGDLECYEGSVFNVSLTLSPVAPPEIPTSLTIDAPSSVAPEETFFISGILYETDSGVPIPSQPINHSYNGRGLGTSITGIDGQYLKEVSVPETGVWTLRSEFPGTEGLQASEARVDSVVAATPLAIALQIAGPIATALALIAYGSR